MENKEIFNNEWEQEVLPENELKQIRKSIRKRNRKTIIISAVLAVAVLLGCVYGIVPAVERLYWNADEFSEAVRYMENPECQKFYLVDIDVSDGWKELAFYEHGPSGDPCTTFLRYQNGELVYIGEIEDGPPGEGRYGSITMEFSGNGTINAIVRYWEFQTDSVKKVWKLVNGSQLNASLEEVVPEYYEFVRNSGWQFNIQLVQNATFYREMNADMENVIMFPEGTRVDFARYYPETGWLEVVYQGGEKSVWLQVTAEKMFMPMNVDIYKYFTGLNAAG